MEPGGLDMQQLFAAAAEMQSQLMNAQQELAETEIEGSAGGGLVKVTISGQGELIDVAIAKEAIDAGDPAETASTLADLILAASRDAYRALADVQAEAMGPLAGSLGGAGGGMPGLPGLPGMPGVPGQPPPPGCRPAADTRIDLARRQSRRPARTEGVRRRRPGPHRRTGTASGHRAQRAQRIAFHLLTTNPEDVRRLAATLVEVTEKVKFCRTCGNVAENDECKICMDVRRDPSVICVVEEPKDVAAIEKIREFRGRYHVLGGAISPMDGIGPEDLRISELMARLADGDISELILAMDPNLEGEATATYLARLVKPLGLRVTRPASGLPVGGDLEYADEVTLGRAFEGRRTLNV